MNPNIIYVSQRSHCDDGYDADVRFGQIPQSDAGRSIVIADWMASNMFPD